MLVLIIQIILNELLLCSIIIKDTAQGLMFVLFVTLFHRLTLHYHLSIVSQLAC